MEEKGLSLIQRIADHTEILRKIMDSVGTDIRVACPGRVTKVNANQTVTVELCIRELIKNENDILEWVEIPPLVDVPICMFRAGGFILTLPIAVNDEVLVVFADSCIDAWWQSGGVQNQVDRRRHDLSDGFALPICWNQTRNVSGYSSSKAQLRNEAGTEYVELGSSSLKLAFGEASITIDSTGITLTIGNTNLSLTAGGITMSGVALALTGTATTGITSPAITETGNVAITGTASIAGKSFAQHTHGGVEPGSGVTGPVT